MKFKTRDIKAFMETIDDDWYVEDWIEEEERELLNDEDLDKLGEIDIPRSYVWIVYQGPDHFGVYDSKEFTHALKKWLKK
jgi:hypothetical protein